MENKPPLFRNRILRALDSESQNRVRLEAQRANYMQGQTVYEVGDPLTHMHFPESGVISILPVLGNGDTIEMATVGREGLVGLGVLLGTEQCVARYYVQISGEGWRIPREVFQRLLEQTPQLKMLLIRYAQVMLDQLLTAGACNSKHPVEARLARWLLMMQDRTDLIEYPFTHNFLAEIFGVYRPTITLAVHKLQRMGAIRTARRSLIISDQELLRQISCDCYERIQNTYDQLLPSSD